MWKRWEYCLHSADFLDFAVRLLREKATSLDVSAARMQLTVGAHREELTWEDDLEVLSELRAMIEDREPLVRNRRREAAEARDKADRTAIGAEAYRHVARHPWLPLPRDDAPNPPGADSP